MYIGRDTENRYLESFYQKEGSQILVMYGGRGIGKTCILKHFAEGRKVSYYMASPVADRQQRAQWSDQLRELGYQLSVFAEYEDILKAVFPEKEEKKVLIIDEFQYLIRGDSDFFRQLVEMIDRRRMSRPVFVILLSSSPGFVENTLVSAIGSGAAYIDGIYKIKELPFRVLCRLFPQKSLQDAFFIYAIAGGVPGFWECFDGSLNFRENVIQNVLRRRSRIYAEMTSYFAEDLREPAVYNTILVNIANGRSKLNDIYEYTGFSRAKISVYLKNLMELNLIEKICPGVYRISVPILNFYYRFLFSELSMTEKMSPEAFFDRQIAPFWQEYVQEAYSRVCRQVYEEDNPDGFEISEWHEKDETLDLVTVDKDARRVAAVCRYCTEFTKADYKKLTSTLRHAKIQPDRLILYTEAGQTAELKQLVSKGKIECLSLGLLQGDLSTEKRSLE